MEFLLLFFGFFNKGRVQSTVRGHALALQQQEFLELFLAVHRVQLEKHFGVEFPGTQRMSAGRVLAAVILGHRFVGMRPRVRLAPTGRVPVPTATRQGHLVVGHGPDTVRTTVRRRWFAVLLNGTQIERGVHVIIGKVRTVPGGPDVVLFAISYGVTVHTTSV